MVLFSAITLCMVSIYGCASEKANSILPTVLNSPTADSISESKKTQTHLWGWYDCYIDLSTQSASAMLNRQAMFTANVVNFINSQPANLGFHINKTPVGPGYVDVDIDVSIIHPFPGLTQYNGYDVRGVFMGDGSAVLYYNPALIYPVLGTDQIMLADTADGFGGPDGYTRWFNKTEFSTGGSPLFQYVPGKVASPGFKGNSTLNGYKYFADGLGATDNLWTWLETNSSNHGVFSSGTKNTRNYYLRFPNTKGVKFGYAITANWEGTAPENHPANAPEAVALSVIDNSDVFYSGPDENGGRLILNLSVFDWGSHLTSGVMEDYSLIIESNILNTPHYCDTADMTAVGGNESYSTYHVEVQADTVSGKEGNYYWVIVERNGFGYTNDFGVTNMAGDDPLAAFFLDYITVGDQSSNPPPVINGITDDIAPDGLNTIVYPDNTSVTYTALCDVPGPGETYTSTWFIELQSATSPSDPPDTMPYDWSPMPVGQYKIWVKVSDGTSKVTSGPYLVSKIIPPWTRSWGSNGSTEAGCSVSVDGSGNIYVVGMFNGWPVDFDPGTGVDPHYPNGGEDAYLTKFNSTGTFQWARTWGGTDWDCGNGVAVDGAGNVYVTGFFQTGYGQDVDFDPGPGVDNHKVTGGNWNDVFLSKFSPTGNFMWAKTWGGDTWDIGYDIDIDSSYNVYVTGYYNGTCDFNPNAGVDSQPNNGDYDVFVSKISATGNYMWARTWGGSGRDIGKALAVDGSGNVCVTGLYQGTPDFDPGSGIDMHSSNGQEDVFLSRISTNGTWSWSKTWGGVSLDEGTGVGMDASGNIYTAGCFTGIVDLDPGPGTDSHTSIGSPDVYLSKFNSAGDFIWAKTWAANNNSQYNPRAGTKMAVDSSGNSYVGGWFGGTADFDPGSGEDSHSSNGAEDIFLSKFDSTGSFLWAKTWGGTGTDQGWGAAVDGSGNYYVTGFFEGTVDFDPGPGEDWIVGNPVNDDAFLTKFSHD
jgi:hypothetical protein